MTKCLTGSAVPSFPEREVALTLTLRHFPRSLFLPLFQQGFEVEVAPETTVQRMLCDDFGITPTYLAERVAAIVLDGKPVDQPETAILEDGSQLALSAAMPGLAGATMRRKGVLASLRESIAYQKRGRRSNTREKGRILVKLFNLLIDELGPVFLERGVLIPGGFLDRSLGELGRICTKIEVNGEPTDRQRLYALDWTNQKTVIQLRLIIAASQNGKCE